MKTYFLFFCFLLVAGFGFSQTNLETREVKILPGSSLSISGNTNINEFECDFNTHEFREESFVINYRNKKGILDFRNSTLPLKNEEFDCGNRRINKDFKELLKTDKHPRILLKVKQIEMRDMENAKVTLNFQIAGVGREYTFPVAVSREEELCFNGSLTLNITDFNLEAPSKVFGLIVIEEEIDINFNLNIKTHGKS